MSYTTITITACTMRDARRTMERNIKLLDKVQTNYYPLNSPLSSSPLSNNYDFEPSPPQDESIYNKTTRREPQTIQYYIDEDTGQMHILGNRYIRLGKVQLHDSIEDTLFSEKKFIAILDTHLQILHCFDIKRLYDQYITSERDHAFTQHGTFMLSDSTKSMILGEIFK